MKRWISFLLALTFLLQVPTGTLAAEPDDPIFRVETVTALPGDSGVKVKILAENNPGIASAKLTITYDDAVLDLTNVEYNAQWGGMSQAPQYYRSPLTLNWFNGVADFTQQNTVYATLTFDVAADAAAETSAIKVSYDPEDVYNIKENNVVYETVDGGITIEKSATEPPTEPAPEGQPVFRVETKEAVPGDTSVIINIWAEKNPGIASVKLLVDYDDSRLTLDNVAFNTQWGGMSQLPQTLKNPVTLNWFNGVADYTEADSIFATLSFDILDSAKDGLASIVVTYDPEDVYNINEINQKFTIISGGIQVTSQCSHTVIIDKEVAPTCTENGMTEGKRCSKCGEVLVKQEVIPAKGHTPGAAATCTEDQICSVCQTVLTTKLGHNYASVVLEPTYTKPGYTQRVCDRCGDQIVDENSYTDALGIPNPIVTGSNDPATGGALLTWEADGEADYYEVYRASSSKGKYSKVATVTEAEAVITLGVGKSAYYKVKAICEDNAELSSDQSKYVKVTGKLAQPTVSVTVNNSGKPVLKWGKVTSAKKYYIYRAEEGGKETKIATVTKTTYTDSKAKPGKTYTYRVRAYGSKSSYTGAYSEGVVCLAKCAQPVITVKINAASGKPDITWKTISGATGYLIQRKLAGEEEFKDIQVVTALKYADLEAPVDTDVEYRVIAQSPENAYDSVPSAIKKSHTTLAKPVVTFKVDDVTGKPVLTWEVVEGAVEYKVYRSTKSSSSYKAVKTTEDLTYTDTSAAVGKSYYYKVIAIGANAKSAYSSYKKLTVKCAQPVITVEANADGKPVIKWGKVSGAKKYYVYRIDENGKQTTLGNTTKTSYTDKKAKEGVSYSYRIRAYGSKTAYNSVYSEDVAFDCE